MRTGCARSEIRPLLARSGCSRRALVQRALGGLVSFAPGGLLSARAVATAPSELFALAPAWGDNWVVHKDPEVEAGVQQLPTGVILRSAPYVYDRNKELYGRSSIALWSRRKWVGDFRIELDFARLDSTDRTTRDGIGTMLYFHATGFGNNTHSESFAQWRSSRPS